MAARWSGILVARLSPSSRVRSCQPTVAIGVEESVGQSRRDDANHSYRGAKIRAIVYHHQPDQVAFGPNIDVVPSAAQLDTWLLGPQSGNGDTERLFRPLGRCSRRTTPAIS